MNKFNMDPFNNFRRSAGEAKDAEEQQQQQQQQQRLSLLARGIAAQPPSQQQQQQQQAQQQQHLPPLPNSSFSLLGSVLQPNLLQGIQLSNRINDESQRVARMNQDLLSLALSSSTDTGAILRRSQQLVDQSQLRAVNLLAQQVQLLNALPRGGHTAGSTSSSMAAAVAAGGGASSILPRIGTTSLDQLLRLASVTGPGGTADLPSFQQQQQHARDRYIEIPEEPPRKRMRPSRQQQPTQQPLLQQFQQPQDESSIVRHLTQKERKQTFPLPPLRGTGFKPHVTLTSFRKKWRNLHENCHHHPQPQRDEIVKEIFLRSLHPSQPADHLFKKIHGLPT